MMAMHRKYFFLMIEEQRLEAAAAKTQSLPAQAEEVASPGSGWSKYDRLRASKELHVVCHCEPGAIGQAKQSGFISLLQRTDGFAREERSFARTLPYRKKGAASYGVNYSGRGSRESAESTPLPAREGRLRALVAAISIAGRRSPGTTILLILTVFSLLLSACGPVAAQGAAPIPADLADRQIRAVATTGMVGDLVRNVGGERVNVTTLMGPGIDPHLYKPSERSVVTLADADVIFYNGLHLEAGMARVFERMEGRKLTVAVTDSIDRSQLAAPPEFQGNYDPHVWFDVSMWMQTVETVRDALAEMDPTHAETYQANAERYLEELEALHAYVEEQAGRIPPEKRVLITAHDAFNYFGRAYGFEVRGLQGISTATEAGTGDVQELAAFIEERQIPAMFVETSVSPRTIEAVQAAVRARGFDVQIGGSLFSDAMGNPGTPEGTYLGMVRHNIDTIVAALSQETALVSGK